MKRRGKGGKVLSRFFLYVFFVLVAVFFLFPVVWTISLSFKTMQELYRFPPKILPSSLYLKNYGYVINQYNIFAGVRNSFYITIVTVVGTLLITIPAAYAFSRIKFALSRVLQFSILLFQMISPIVMLIPLYRYFSRIGLLNSYFGLIAIYIAVSIPFQVWFIRGFLDTIPVQLDEAATIDGCNRLQTVTRVLLPVITPGLFSASLLVFISSWSQFVVPYILISAPARMPVSVSLVNLQSSLTSINTQFLAAGSVVAIAPTIVLFVILQKFIVSAMTAGAIKG
ncbi:MAG: carbohydrate ABC transporter permease [Treponema sp.]|jgi:multiple sugar transport system permease protein|nr:carbohydrate ABC transporter permease [Treponema sp.]